MVLYDFIKFAHVLTVIFMAVPLYNLIVVNERALFGKAHLDVDRYFETLIRGSAIRCYVFQVSALVTGLLLVWQSGPLSALVENWVLGVKLILLLILTALLSVVHFSVQPGIDALLARAEGEKIPDEIAARIGPLRLRRKRLAATCLFLVVVTVLLGMQTARVFPWWMSAGLIVLAALFCVRVFRSRMVYGWF